MIKLYKLNLINPKIGSTFILVLAILAILVLTATTLSLSSRLEMTSASNYSQGIQARMSAFTGVRSSASQFIQSQTNMMFSTTNANIEVYDESGKAIDYRIIDVNPQYEKILN